MKGQSPISQDLKDFAATLPVWRRGAEAGIPLAVAQAKAADSGTALVKRADQMVVTSGTTTPQPKDIRMVLRPNVRDRWLASQIGYFTPQIVENTFRGAMTGNLLAQWLLFDLMEQTWPELSKNLNELKNAVIDLDWNLQAYALKGDKPSAEATRRHKLMEQMIWAMKPELDADERDFEDTQYDIMDAVGKGISANEILWQRPDDPENKTGMWLPRATRWVHPRYYGYSPQPGTEDRLQLNLMEVRMVNPEAAQWLQTSNFRPQIPNSQSLITSAATDGLYARFPKDQFIISICKQKSGHPISGAMLRVLGFWWAASNFAWEWFLNLGQLFGVPIRWAEYSQNANLGTITAIEDMLANMGSAGWAAFPAGTKLNIHDALQSAKDNPAKGLIDAANIVCDVVILGQTLTTQQGERGSQSLGTIHKSIRDERIQTVAKRTAKILNGQFLPAICRMNFGDDTECPWFQPSTKEAKDVQNTATRYKTLLSIPGVEISKQQFYEDNDLVIPDPEDEVIVGQAAAQGPGDVGASGAPERGASGDAATATARAHAATEKLTTHVLEDLTGVEVKWLGGVKPLFRKLCAAALSDQVSDEQFIRTVERAKKEMPELFHKLNHAALAKSLEEAMGAAVVNGAVRGAMKRGSVGRGGTRPHHSGGVA